MEKEDEDLYELSFLRRVGQIGPGAFLKSYDTVAGAVVFLGLFIVTDGGIARGSAEEMLNSIAAISATLFAIVLTGLTIITSFSSPEFIYAWQEIDEFENVITYFQYNLTLPIAVLLSTFTLMVHYDPIGMLVLLALLVYMLISMLDLVGLVSRFALQRGEFVSQKLEQSQKDGNETSVGDQFSKQELIRLAKILSEHDDQDR